VKKFFKSVLVATVTLVIVFLISYKFFSLPVSPDSDNQDFVVNQGDSLRQIAKRLELNGLIKNQYFFILESYRTGLNSKLQAGQFQLSPSLSLSQVVSKLSKGGSFDFWYTIIPGQRLEEFALDSEFETLARPSEGMLFPDKYLIPQNYSNQQIIDLILKNYQQKFPNLNYQDLILASLIEREAKTFESKKMISGILKNRLGINMALQVDATVQYARDSQSKPEKYWSPLSSSNLQIKSAYNTYQNPGLPPAPICNPGADSINAALNPTASDYIFYITGNDGQMYYAKTLSQHNQNIANHLR
jgi:UPF0755 protein